MFKAPSSTSKSCGPGGAAAAARSSTAVLSHPEEVAAARCLPMEAVDAGSGAPHAVEDQQGAAIAAAARASSSAAAAAAPEEASPSEVRGLCGSAAVSPSSTAVLSHPEEVAAARCLLNPGTGKLRPPLQNISKFYLSMGASKAGAGAFGVADHGGMQGSIAAREFFWLHDQGPPPVEGGIFLDFGSGNSFALHLAAARFPQLEMAVGIEREMGSQSSWENSIDVKAREVSENVDATGGCAVITINGDLTKCRSLSKSVTAAYVFVAHPLQAHWAVFLCAQANCVLRVTAPNKDCVDGLGLPEGCRMPRKLSMTCHRDSCHAFVFALTKKQWNVVERTMTSEPFLQHHPEFRARLDAKRVEDERELRAARARAGSVRSVRSSAAEKKNEVVARGEENAAGAEGDAPLPSNDGSMSVAHLREATMTDADRNTSPWAMAGVLDQITSFGKDGLCWQVLKHITRLNETRADVPKRNRTTSIARYSPSFETPPKKNSSENCQTNQQSSSGQKQRQASSSKKQTSSTSSSTSSTSSTSSASSTSSRSGRSGRSSASTSASASGRSTGKGHGQGVAGRRSESDSDGRSGDRGPVNHDGVAAAPTNTRARRSSTSTSASFSSTTSTSGRSTRSSASTSRAVAANQLQQGASSGKKFGKAVARRLHRSAEAAAVAKQLGRNANDPGAFSVGFLVACLCFELHRNQPLNNPNAVHHALHAEAAATGKRKAATSPVNARKKSRTRVTRSQQQDISETEKRNLNGTFEVEGSDDDDDDAVAPNGRDPLVLMYSPPEGASDSAVTLFQSDVERLSQRDGLLNGRLLDFMLLRLSSTKRTVGAVGEAPCGGTAASSEPQSGSGVRADGTPVDHSIVEKSFFCSTSWHAQAWPRKQSINFFVYRFVFVPVQEGNHWFLVVLVNLDNLKANWRAKKKSQAAAAANASDSRAPYVLVLDSSKAARGAAGKRKLREVLSNLFRNLDETWTSHCSQSSGGTEEERGAEKDKDHADFEAHVHGLFFDRSSSDSDHKPLPVRMAEVPQQTNRCDSGAYCYQNAEEVCVRGREVSEVSDADLKRNSFLHGSFNATMYAASDVRGKRAAFARLIGALRSEKETEKRTLNGAFEVEGSEDDDDAVAPNGHAGDDEEGYGGRRAPCEWAWADVWAHANYLGWKASPRDERDHRVYSPPDGSVKLQSAQELKDYFFANSLYPPQPPEHVDSSSEDNYEQQNGRNEEDDDEDEEEDLSEKDPCEEDEEDNEDEEEEEEDEDNYEQQNGRSEEDEDEDEEEEGADNYENDENDDEDDEEEGA